MRRHTNYFFKASRQVVGLFTDTRDQTIITNEVRNQIIFRTLTHIQQIFFLLSLKPKKKECEWNRCYGRSGLYRKATDGRNVNLKGLLFIYLNNWENVGGSGTWYYRIISTCPKQRRIGADE